MQDSLVKEVFDLLGEAKKLEDNACTTASDHAPLQKQEMLQQSANKYHEACFLMKHVRKSSSEIDEVTKELFAKKINHYGLHAQDLLDKVEGLKLSDKQKPRKKSIGGRIDNDNGDDNGESSDGKKRVSVEAATEGLRSAGTKGKRFLRKAKENTLNQAWKGLKNVVQQDQKTPYSYEEGYNGQDNIGSNWVSVNPEYHGKDPEQNNDGNETVVTRTFKNEDSKSSWEAPNESQHSSANNNGENAIMAQTPVDYDPIHEDTSHINERKLEAKKYADQANRLLATALDNDERGEKSKAISQYLNAVQCYSNAIKVLEGGEGMGTVTASGESPMQSPIQSPELVAMKKNASLALDRVEKLKLISQFNGPIIAIPSSAVPSAPPQSSTNQPVSTHTNSNTNQPGKLTADEIEVLKWSSRISSGVFLPWQDDEAQKFNKSPTRSWLTVPDNENKLLPLSDKQKERGCKWARPTEIVAMRGHNKSSCKIAMINSITPYTIKQHCVSDCSFIAGLCISAAFERRFDRRLVSSLIYPQDPNTGMPVYNPQGVYMVKLWLNGVARRVLVDDLLPVDDQGNLLCSHTTALGKSNGSVLELWVPILEKAYMKLCGGYDFPGSNSGVDLFCLTGWIPERVYFPKDPTKLKDFETPAERAWERLYNANSYGDCLITLSTSKELSDEQAEKVGLFTGHAYAVLGVVQTSNGTRLLQLKNPWASKGWKGRFSAQDKESWKDPKFCAEVGYDATSASQYDDGVFWMSWDDILLYFRNIHMSWNRSLFRFRTPIHGFWRKDVGPKDDSYNVGDNPQYTITLSEEAIQKKATLWILLSRHVTKQEQEGGEASDYLALHIHRVQNPQQRVWYPMSNCILSGEYTNNQHVLVRYDAAGPEDRNLSIVLSQHEKSNNLGYTLSCFCTEKFNLGDPEQPLPMYQELSGSWQLRDSMEDKSNMLAIGTAGGPPGKGSFGSNPQWSIRVPTRGVRIQVKCMAPKKIPVNIILARSNSNNGQQSDTNDQMSQRIHRFYENPIIDTGKYRHGFVVSEIVPVPAGVYTLCASTYEVGQVGTFLLHIFSSNEVQISKID